MTLRLTITSIVNFLKITFKFLFLFVLELVPILFVCLCCYFRHFYFGATHLATDSVAQHHLPSFITTHFPLLSTIFLAHEAQFPLECSVKLFSFVSNAHVLILHGLILCLCMCNYCNLTEYCLFFVV